MKYKVECNRWGIIVLIWKILEFRRREIFLLGDGGGFYGRSVLVDF